MAAMRHEPATCSTNTASIDLRDVFGVSPDGCGVSDLFGLPRYQSGANVPPSANSGEAYPMCPAMLPLPCSPRLREIQYAPSTASPFRRFSPKKKFGMGKGRTKLIISI